MLEQSAGQSLVTGTALHARCAGPPYRLQHFRRARVHLAAARDHVWLTRSGAIAEHFDRLVPA